MRFPTNDSQHPLARELKEFIKDPTFPCVGAKSALSRGQMRVLVARDIASGWDDTRIYPALLAFICRYRDQPDLFQSFAVVFEGAGRPVGGGVRAAPLGAGAIALRQGRLPGPALRYSRRADPDDPISRCPSAARRSSSSVSIPARAARPGASPVRSSSSTSTPSSSSCASRAATRSCASPSCRETLRSPGR